THPIMLDAADIFLLSQTACLAICKALERYGKGVSIKWPNDIYWGDRKMVGILIENELAARKVSESIVGVGVNVNQRHFPLGLPNPTSLALELGHEVERGEVLEGIVAEFCALYDALGQGMGERVREEYLSRLYRRGEACRYRDQDGEFTATLLTVETGGHLVLRDEGGTLRRYAFKEVNFII
ncbi:MAG: biotin--[acetyl-CoA-carboxylase] ligase, partial [Prevotellaceae bacterium]|nr:biotin--[acetyl-CoA-carboxylase] ligase [Prevotellaceae bacterium]